MSSRSPGGLDDLVRARLLERVQPSPAVAGRLLDDAERHVSGAEAVRDIDPAGALHLAYDAARKACAAMLADRGLRATARGGHVATIEGAALLAPAGRRDVIRRTDRLRRRRHTSEYPGRDSPSVTAADAAAAIEHAVAVVAAARSFARG